MQHTREWVFKHQSFRMGKDATFENAGNSAKLSSGLPIEIVNHRRTAAYGSM